MQRNMLTQGLGIQMNAQPNLTAADQMAALTRQQWADYVSLFMPYENDLIEYATWWATTNGVTLQEFEAAA